MNDVYNQELAAQFMRNGVQVGPGDRVWIEHHGPDGLGLAEACAAEVLMAGGVPTIVDNGGDALTRALQGLDAAGIEAHGAERLALMRTMQGYIRIHDDADQAKLILQDWQVDMYKAAMAPVVEYRVKNTRWLVTAAPTERFADDFRMSYPAFREFYRKVCLLDYSRMTDAVAPLQKLMATTKHVRILSPEQETDVSFSIAGIGAVPCTGQRNIPDGECYTAPVRDSVNGRISFGPSKYDGHDFGFIKLEFAGGRIVKAIAECKDGTARLNHILDRDEGARYVGEFSLNFNPFIQHPVGNILFDEKIDGGIHMAMGTCYDTAYNGNKSIIHWDMVHIQRPDYGGGEIWFDGTLIRKDGLFVLPELQALNPENLKAATAA